MAQDGTPLPLPDWSAYWPWVTKGLFHWAIPDYTEVDVFRRLVISGAA